MVLRMSSVLTRSSLAGASLLMAASAVLSGCGMVATLKGGDEPTPAQETSTGQSSSNNGSGPPGAVDSTSSADPSPSESTDPAAEREVPASEQRQKPSDALPNGAFRGGGGPVPDGAADASSISKAADGSGRSVAVVESPSGNILCEIYSDGESGCQVKKGDRPFPTDPATDKPANYIATSGSSAPARQAVPEQSVLTTGSGAQSIAYGQQVEYAGVVCASESNGMTCWDAKTGHGAFMNRAGLTGF